MPEYTVRVAPAALVDIGEIADFYSELMDEVVAFSAFHTSGRPSKYAKALVERLEELK